MGDPGESTMPSDTETLLELNRHYVRAAQESDVAWYADNLADDYMSSTPEGALLDRAGFLQRMSHTFPGTGAQAVEPRVRIMGDVAFIHSGFRWTKADASMGVGRYTDMYAKRGGRWLCVSAHFNAH
jgi:ketosteroid isomerase-like protein